MIGDGKGYKWMNREGFYLRLCCCCFGWRRGAGFPRLPIVHASLRTHYNHRAHQLVFVYNRIILGQGRVGRLWRFPAPSSCEREWNRQVNMGNGIISLLALSCACYFEWAGGSALVELSSELRMPAHKVVNNKWSTCCCCCGLHCRSFTKITRTGRRHRSIWMGVLISLTVLLDFR